MSNTLLEKRVELWRSIVSELYPNLSQNMLLCLLQDAAAEYLDDTDSPLNNLFEQYIIMKALSNLSKDSDN